MLLTLCRNLVMHRDSFILVKHITETRRRRLNLFVRENYHGFLFFFTLFSQENHSSWFIRFSSAVCLLICPMEGTSLGIGTIVWKIGWCSFQIFLMLIFFLWLITYTFSVCGGQGVSLWRDKGRERNSGNLPIRFMTTW